MRGLVLVRFSDRPSSGDVRAAVEAVGARVQLPTYHLTSINRTMALVKLEAFLRAARLQRRPRQRLGRSCDGTVHAQGNGGIASDIAAIAALYSYERLALGPVRQILSVNPKAPMQVAPTMV